MKAAIDSFEVYTISFKIQIYSELVELMFETLQKKSEKFDGTSKFCPDWFFMPTTQNQRSSQIISDD